MQCQLAEGFGIYALGYLDLQQNDDSDVSPLCPHDPRVMHAVCHECCAEGRVTAAERAGLAAGGPDPLAPSSAPTVTVAVSIRALMPVLSAPAVAVALRLVQTIQDYSRSADHWRSRPQVCLSTSPSLIRTSRHSSSQADT